jgi:hypothetical protein
MEWLVGAAFDAAARSARAASILAARRHNPKNIAGAPQLAEAPAPD